jgi:Uncharacterized vancomycin resistance protein
MRAAAGGALTTVLPAFVLLSVAAFGLTFLARMPDPEVRLSGFATRLEGRSGGQRHNALLAARALDGAVIPPGGTFSFNRRVNSWSADAGYVKAPVSFDGELVPAFGGGVCQTSTTLYNAALLAGMEVTERHHHVFAPHYAAPGRDAAVAYPNIDLRFVNPYPFPVRVAAKADGAGGDTLRVELWGKQAPEAQYALRSRVLSVESPAPVVRRVPADTSARRFARSAAATGFRVVTYRVTIRNGQEIRRERLSDDSYPAMPRVLRFAEVSQR